MAVRVSSPVALALGLAALAAGPALAAPTARVTGNIAVHAGPGPGYAQVGRLANGQEVTLDYCTPDRPQGRDRFGQRIAPNWCLVTGTGWVDASWLVGWSARIGVTPPTWLVDPASPF